MMKHSEEFKQEAVRIALTSGLSRERVAKDLGNFYAQGIGVPRDYAQAANLFRLAARQGYALAQTNLGALYSKGLGVTENSYKGYLWSIIAAAAGDDQAMVNRDVTAGRLSTAERSAAERQAAACVEAKFQLESCN